ncbi:MAG: response regulator, partial [Ignavibacteriales bacterium]|nr:response regulator [Ignavibacteriales bacterium]
SLKGAARAVNVNEVESICQTIENAFALMKKGELTAGKEIFSQIHFVLDLIDSFLFSPAAEKKTIIYELEKANRSIAQLINTENILPKPRGNSAAPEPPKQQVQPLSGINTSEIESIKAKFLGVDQPQKRSGKRDGREKQEPGRKKTEKPSQIDSFKISSYKLDKLYLLSEEMLASRLNFDHISGDLQSLLFMIESWKREWRKNSAYVKLLRKKTEKTSAGQDASAGYNSGKLLEFLDWNNGFIEKFEKKLRGVTKSNFQNSKQLGSQLNLMVDDLKEIMILPFAHLTDMFPKVVYDLARDLGKEVEFVAEGTNLEVDKRILEELKDALLHLIRNAVDHGIEPPEERLKNGKAARGKIHLIISQIENNRVEILLVEDGRGININLVVQSAIQRGLLKKDELKKLSEQDKLQLVFRSGISTSQVITEISGRGLGMAIVKDKVEKLDGFIKIESSPGTGTRFTISLPLSIAAMRGITVKNGEHTYIIPTTKVNRVLRVLKKDIKSIENRKTIILDDIPVLLVYLGEILEQTTLPETTSEFYTILLLSTQEYQAAFIVDELVDENDIVLKPFNRQIEKLKFIAGSTILGDGKVAPILNTQDLVLSAVKHVATSVKPPSEQKSHEVKKILVVDDSITSRMLVKDILESSGFTVITAIDGVDALTALKSESFHIVISDVEMPRMNGFDLTSAIKKDSKLHGIPVILVTGLAKREDREKGIDSGANAYIVKSGFDQSILLDTINRLIL